MAGGGVEGAGFGASAEAAETTEARDVEACLWEGRGMPVLTVTVLTVSLSASWGGYVGMYADPLHCRAMMDVIADDDPGAVIRCEPVVLREPVPIPPPRPDNLKPRHVPVLVPPMRPLR